MELDMNNDTIYNLLNIIKFNENICNMTNLSFVQVALYIDLLKQNDLIEFDRNLKMIISKSGNEFIHKYETVNNIISYSKYILPNKQMWKEPTEKFDVYIPPK